MYRHVFCPSNWEQQCDHVPCQTWQLCVFFSSVRPFWSSSVIICRPFVLNALSFLPSFHFPSDFMSLFTLVLLTNPPLLLLTINNMRLLSNSSAPLSLHPTVGPDLSPKLLEASSCQHTIQTCHKIPGNFPNPVIYLLKFGFFLMLITVLFPRAPLWKASKVLKIASYLISPTACGHMVARLRKKRQSGTILIIPTF